MLINDCSDKETSDYLESFVNSNSGFILVNNKENLGFVKSCNNGIKVAKGEIIILLNSDTIIPSEFCERIIKCFNSDEKIVTSSPISSCSARYFIELPKNMTLE
ncbi:glycosyltransferase family 2 protein [bacterium]|nr:glycosyltransferase family 2 protein [bacterium]